MSSLITGVFKLTVGLLADKVRDRLAEEVREGDITDQRFRRLIVREINEIDSKLDGLAKKELGASGRFLKEGIEYLYDVFERARSSSEHRAIAAAVEQFEQVAREMRNFELSTLDKVSTNKLAIAKKRFKKARVEATIAFSNGALKLPDRLLAMQYRVMATVLETIDNLEDCLTACNVCIEDLHDLLAVKKCFKVEFKKGLRGRLSKKKRREIISTVCSINRVVYNVKLKVRFDTKGELSKNWPCVKIGKESVNPLQDQRVAEVLNKQGMVHCSCLPRSFGQEGEEEHTLKYPRGIATNTKGHFLIVDDGDKTVKVFISNGKFDFGFNPQTDDADIKLYILDVATTGEDNKIYLLVELTTPGAEKWKWEVQIFRKTADPQHETADLLHKFPVRKGDWYKLTVSSGKILLLADNVVDVHEPNGEFVCSFGRGVFKRARDITATCDGHVMIVDPGDHSLHLFDVEGHQLGKFNINEYETDDYRIECHPASKHVVLAGREPDTDRLTLAIYTVNGKFVRRIPLDAEVRVKKLSPSVVDIHAVVTVTVEGHIAVAFIDKHDKGQVIVV